MDYKDINYRVEEAAAIITIDREKRLNAFRGRTIEELIHAFKRTFVEEGVACVILTGAGRKAFCVGGDQKEWVETGSYGTSENGLFEIETLHEVIRNCPKPVIAMFSGVRNCRENDFAQVIPFAHHGYTGQCNQVKLASNRGWIRPCFICAWYTHS